MKILAYLPPSRMTGSQLIHQMRWAARLRAGPAYDLVRRYLIRPLRRT